MSEQDFARDTLAPVGDGNRPHTGKAANDAFAKASDAVRETTAKAKQAASNTASTVTGQVKELLDRQIVNGANMAGQFAGSAKLAADDLNQQSPVMAGMVRTIANTIENCADDLHDQTAAQLTGAASDFTRRQPALVFGLAAVAGFFVFRTIKSSQSVASPLIQSTQGGEESWHKSN